MPENPDHEPSDPALTPATTPGEGQATETVDGKTRAEWDAELRKRVDDAWMEAHRGHLDDQWAYMVQTLGD